jgi:hypothetical protein
VAPSYADHVAAFGSDGLKVDAAGTPIGYEYPKPKDEAERRKINNQVLEMWGPHRRKSVELGGARNAKRKTARVRNRKTGQVEVIPEDIAERKVARGVVVEVNGHRATARFDGERLVRPDGTVPPSRFHEIVESGKAPAGFVH